MKTPIFKPEDFGTGNNAEKASAALYANMKMEKLIESAPMIYGHELADAWWLNKDNATRKARLMFIEEIKKETCKHEPKVSVSIRGFDLSKATHLHQVPEQFYCLKCGVELQAAWSEKK